MEKIMKYYSQYGQDRWLYETFYKNKKDGFFLEVGCIDGIHLSNTKFFEDLGWNGLCIEPSPSNFIKLRENRSCVCENVAASNYEGYSKFLDIHGYGQGLSGLTEKYDLKHKERIDNETKRQDNKGKTIVTVKVEPLRNILKRHNIKHIDFCTIDTEGGELEILESINFDEVTIDIIFVENNYNEDKNKKFLESKGYTLIHKIGSDEVYFKRKINNER